MAFTNEFRVKVVTDVLAGKEVPDVAKEYGVSDQSVRNWLADPQVLAIAISGGSDEVLQVERPSSLGELTDKHALALYLLSKCTDLDVSGEILCVCEAAGADMLDALAYGEKLDKRRKLIEAAVKESSKYIDKLQNDVTKLNQRLVDQKDSFEQVIQAMKTLQADGQK